MINNNNVGCVDDEDFAPVRAIASWFSKITQLHCLVDGSLLNTFEKLDNPKRIYGLGKTFNETMLMTKQIWSLESMFCHNRTLKSLLLHRHRLMRTLMLATLETTSLIARVIVTH